MRTRPAYTEARIWVDGIPELDVGHYLRTPGGSGYLVQQIRQSRKPGRRNLRVVRWPIEEIPGDATVFDLRWYPRVKRKPLNSPIGFPSDAAARAVSVLLKNGINGEPIRHVYQSAGRNADGGSGKWFLTYGNGEVELTTRDVEILERRGWLQRAPDCAHISHFRSGRR